MATTFKPLPFRSHDYIYDPLFVVSGPKDHHKAAMIAALSNAKFQICPVFPNMFSDSPNYPNKQLIRRKTAPAPPYKHYKTQMQKKNDVASFKKVDVAGSDRCKYFYPPVLSLSIIPNLQLQTTREEKVVSVKNGKTKTKKIQTQYRESSAQTSPWQPPYVVTDQSDPELLKLDFLKWGSGLPAGMHEVQLIERARMKRAWEKKFEQEGPENLGKRREIIEAMERDEWAFREQEIQDIQDLRLKLLEEMLNELHEKSKNRSEAKLKSFAEIKCAEKEEKLRKLQNKTKRELRKLEMKEAGIDKKYHTVNVIVEHADRTSELYGPQIRFGEHPKRWHQVINSALQKYKAQFVGVEQFNTLPNWLDQATKMKDCCCIKLPGTRLCMRETKWTTPVLRQLHEELKVLRKTVKRPCRLLTRIDSPPSECCTAEVEAIPDQDEEFYQAIIALQSIIKGRASQTIIYEGRDRCRQLIKELKFSHGLLEDQHGEIYKNKLTIKLQQREDQIENDRISKLQEKLAKLQGTIVGSLLDFLNKELRRLLEERRAHAICLLLERERHDREAAEAGRRQIELRRRREHDEMFRQIIKVHQDTVDLYLEDIIKEGVEFASDQEAKEYITKLAKKIDEDTYKTMELTDVTMDDEEEAVANLVHHFVLPEVEKQMVRKRITKKQKENLRTVHDAIYSEMEEIPPSDNSNK